ncbi:MAG: hypothetical protein KF749_04375 [Bacteroidetes bacterium]|nr:hypothetical protein [Bacteroidota bacterium]MCW5897613.1 hypothetical protein [Bacteroidota bacterium]
MKTRTAMNTKSLFCYLAVVYLLTQLSQGCARQEKSIEQEPATNQKAAQQTTALLKFKTVSYVDKHGIGIEAFRVLIPTDWTFDGGIRWVLDNPGMPAVAGFRITSPDGKDEVETFPNQSFFWTTNQMTLQLKPIGSKYFGAEVRSPVGPMDALRKIVLPRFRRGYKDLRIISEQPLPELAQALGAGQSQQGISAGADGASMRVEYPAGQTMREEELYAVVEWFSFPVQSMFGTQTNTMWTVGYIFSFKSDKGKLDEQSKLFQTIVSSFKLNPQWFSRYNQVVEYLIKQQIQQIHNIGELSRIISRTHNEISDMMMETYTNRQNVYDKISENFSRNIRGVDGYYDPVKGETVELPSGYNDGWVNGLGEYILSDNPNYNPNIGSNQNWQRMERK